MNDDVSGVDQNPVALRQALDPRGAHARSLASFNRLIRDGAHMGCRSSRCDQHLVGERRFTAQVDRDNVLGFRIFQTN